MTVAKPVGKMLDAYALLVRMMRFAQAPFLLLVRLYWGWQFTQTGWGKLHNLPQITQFFTTLHLPFPGFTAPFVATVLSINMLVAYWTADRVAFKSILSDPGKFYNADPYTFLFASLMILIFGAGLFSIDEIGRRWLTNDRN